MASGQVGGAATGSIQERKSARWPAVVAEYGIAGAISLVAAVPLLELWRANLRVPFDYGGDGLQYEFIIKTVLERGWFWSNPRVGAPSTFDFGDFPVSAHDSLHLLLIKVLSIFGGDWALLTNVYFLLGFPLITCAALFVLRRFGVSYVTAVMASVLYSFLPCRLIKGENHLFLDVFFGVPLAVLAILWVSSEDPPLYVDSGRPWPSLSLASRESIATIAICAVVASTSVYFAFFAICLVTLVGAFSSLGRRSLRPVLSGLTVSALVIAGLLLLGLPSIVYHWHHGGNPAVGTRNNGEAEIYGMKIAQLLLPTNGHRVEALRLLKDRYNESTPLGGENGTTTLGFVGGAGFLVLLGVLLLRAYVRRSDGARGSLLERLAGLNIAAVLLGTIGGFGSLLALLISPQIRTYSRINVYIAFFALFAVALLIERLRAWRPAWGTAVAVTLLGLGLLDQASPHAVRPYAENAKAFASDERFIRKVEASLPASSMVFVLPYMAFPEGVAARHLSSYDLLRFYLHSSTLRWSFPAMRGREADRFARTTAGLGPEGIVTTLASVGFKGLMVARDGYDDRGSALLEELQRKLGAPPTVDERGRFAFFDLSGFETEHAIVPVSGEVEKLLHPFDVRFSTGFFGEEQAPTGPFRWCGSDGDLTVDNDMDIPRLANLRLTFIAGRPPAKLSFKGDILSGEVALTDALPFARDLVIPPGHHVVHFHCDARPIDARPDPRRLVWRIDNFSLKETSGVTE